MSKADVRGYVQPTRRERQDVVDGRGHQMRSDEIGIDATPTDTATPSIAFVDVARPIDLSGAPARSLARLVSTRQVPDDLGVCLAIAASSLALVSDTARIQRPLSIALVGLELRVSSSAVSVPTAVCQSP